MRRLVFAVGAGVCLAFATSPPAIADSLPINYVGVNFAPITSTVSSNYDLATGEMTPGTATGTVSSNNGIFQAAVADPTPPNPQGFGTFIGTARPIRFEDETVVYTQSACPTPTCLADGSFTFGYFVDYPLRGDSLDQLTNLAAMYNIQSGDCGGGSPRFSIVMSNGDEIHVYFGHAPAFTKCLPPDSWQSTGNLVTDPEPRWDSTQIGGTFYGTYSEAVALANAQGLTISAFFVATDSGWFGTNPATTQTVLYKMIEVNDITRFAG